MVRLSDLPDAFVDALWQRMNEAVQVLFDGKMLGCVVFQFHTPFGATSEHIAYVAECRKRLDARFPMAIEFRSRAWYASTPPVTVFPEALYPPSAAASNLPSAAGTRIASGTGALSATDSIAVPVVGHAGAAVTSFTSQKAATLYFMRKLNIINIPSDDLAVEMPPHDPIQPSYKDGR